MNKRKQNKIMRELGLTCFSELSEAWQTEMLMSRFCDFSTDDAAVILSQIPDSARLLRAYFDEMIHLIINYEPLIMFEFLDAKEHSGKLMRASADFKKAAEVLISYSAWFGMESSVFIETEESGAFFSVQDTIALIREEGDPPNGEEKLIMSYEGDVGGVRYMKDAAGSGAELEMAIEALFEQMQYVDQKDSNSRLN